MELAKYQTFLSDNDVYRQNQQFWRETVSSLSQEPFDDWVITTFTNGEDFFDGNPIFSALYVSKSKAIRIIQIRKDAFTPELRVWLENVQDNNRSIKELVVVMQTNDNAFKSVKSIISAFLQDISITKYVNSYNALYRSKANQAQAKSVISSFEKSKGHSEAYILKQSDLPVRKTKRTAKGQM